MISAVLHRNPTAAEVAGSAEIPKVLEPERSVKEMGLQADAVQSGSTLILRRSRRSRTVVRELSVKTAMKMMALTTSG